MSSELLRILHVTPYYERATGYGGIPRAASALVGGLERRGHRLTVCTTDARDGTSRLPAPSGTGRFQPFPPAAVSERVEVRVFPNISNRLAYRVLLQAPVGLRSFLARHAGDFDVAHLHGCHNMPGATAARALRRAGVPYVLQPHGTAARIERRKAAKLAFDMTLGRGVLSGAARVLAVSEFERTRILRLGVEPSRIRVIGNAVNVAEFGSKGGARTAAGIGTTRKVLYLGTLTPLKNVDILVRAFALLKQHRARLVIAGNDLGSGPRIRGLVRELGLDAHTSFTGLLELEERLDALANADVLVYPSRDDVFGLVPIEALLCGTPVVVADDSGCGEVIRRVGGGLLFRAGDADALVAAISTILDNPGHWQDEVTAAAARVRTMFNADTIAEQVESLYWEVLSTGGGANQ